MHTLHNDVNQPINGQLWLFYLNETTALVRSRPTIRNKDGPFVFGTLQSD